MSQPSAQADGESPSTSSSQGARTVKIHGTPVPLNWLLAKDNGKKLPDHVYQTPAQLRQANRDISWANKREHLFAAAAAGVHLALFAYNLAFWGLEGMPPDRYWPSQTRLKLGIKPGRYGNLEGTKRVYYDNLARLEGVD